MTAGIPPAVGVADPAAGVPGNGTVGSGVGEGGGAGVGVSGFVGGGDTGGGDATGDLAAFGEAVAWMGKAGAAEVGVGDTGGAGVGKPGGAGVGATTTIAVVAGPGRGVASPHAATSHTPTATGVRTRANVRINGVTDWGIENSSGARSF